MADPLTVFGCSLISDGAAAVLVMPLDRASAVQDRPVRVRAVSQASDHVALEDRDDITTFGATRAAWSRRGDDKSPQLA